MEKGREENRQMIFSSRQTQNNNHDLVEAEERNY